MAQDHGFEVATAEPLRLTSLILPHIHLHLQQKTERTNHITYCSQQAAAGMGPAWQTPALQTQPLLRLRQFPCGIHSTSQRFAHFTHSSTAWTPDERGISLRV